MPGTLRASSSALFPKTGKRVHLPVGQRRRRVGGRFEQRQLRRRPSLHQSTVPDLSVTSSPMRLFTVRRKPVDVNFLKPSACTVTRYDPGKR